MTIAGDLVASEDHLLTHIENSQFMSPQSVRFIIIHCSATRCDRDYTPEQLKHDHLLRGFIDVGYHYYIRKDGTTTQHRRLNEVGAHCRPFNRCSIGISFYPTTDNVIIYVEKHVLQMKIFSNNPLIVCILNLSFFLYM